MKPANRFVKGQSVYTCTCCGRKTRQVGTGDCENVQMCFDCYEMAGIENAISDGGDIAEHAAAIFQHCGSLISKGANLPVEFELLREDAIALLSNVAA